MKGQEDGIRFKEIKTYEEAYYYNSDPDNRVMYKNDKDEIKDIKKRRKNGLGTLLEIIFDVVEGILESII